MMADAIGSEFDIDDDDTDGDTPAKGDPKALRAAYAKMKKDNADLLAKVTELSNFQRKSTVSELFKARNIPDKAAGLYSGDATPEALDAWLGEYGELIEGYQKASGETASDEETVSAATKMQNATSSARSADPAAFDPATLSAELTTAMQGPNPRESMNAVYAKHGMVPSS